MAVEIAGVTLDKLVAIEAEERPRFAHHAVPGLDGEYVQELGRPSVRIRILGIFYGADAGDRLRDLRGHMLDRQPVDFVCELVGEGYFSQIVIEAMEVGQKAGRPDEFDFECRLTEYVPLPPLPAVVGISDLDAGALGEARSMMDDVQNALGQLTGIANLLSGASNFGDPTSKLQDMPTPFRNAVSGADKFFEIFTGPASKLSGMLKPFQSVAKKSRETTHRFGGLP